MKLAETGAVPMEAMTKLHMVRAKVTPTGIEVFAALDHNGDHSQPFAHMKLSYDAAGKLVSHQYVDGYINPMAPVFTQASTALLFDLATEIVFEGENPELLAFADGVFMVHLDYLAPTDQAIFAMIDDNKKVLELITDMNGGYVSHQFAQ